MKKKRPSDEAPVSQQQEQLKRAKKNDESQSSVLVEQYDPTLEATVDSAEQADQTVDSGSEKPTCREPKKGVVYLVTIPGRMTAGDVRDYFAKLAPVGRVYLAAEDKGVQKGRARAAGKHETRLRYTEGWVEFMRKSDAKRIAELLHNQPLGGKKSAKNLWRDALWNLKYLPRFKWHHLVQFLTEKHRTRSDKKQAALLIAERERLHFIEQVSRKKQLEKIQEKLAGREQEKGK